MFNIRKFVKQYGSQIGIIPHDNKGQEISIDDLDDGDLYIFIKNVVKDFENSAFSYVYNLCDDLSKRFLDNVKKTAINEELQDCRQYDRELARRGGYQFIVKDDMIDANASIKETIMDLLSKVCFDVNKQDLQYMFEMIRESSNSFGVSHAFLGKDFETMNPEEKMNAIHHYLEYDHEKLYSFIEEGRDFCSDMYDALSFQKTRSVLDINKHIYKLKGKHANKALMQKYATDNVKVYDASKRKHTMLVHSMPYSRTAKDLTVSEIIEQARLMALGLIESQNSNYSSRSLSVVESSRPVTYRSVDADIQLLYGELDPELVFSVAPYDAFTRAESVQVDGKTYGKAYSTLFSVFGTCQYLIESSIKNKNTKKNHQMNEVASLILNDNSTSRQVEPKAVLCYNEITTKEIEFAKAINLPIVYSECKKKYETNAPSQRFMGKVVNGSLILTSEKDYLLDL